MDQDLKQLGSSLLEADFQRRGDVMDARERQIVSHGAVAGHINLVADEFNLHLVHVQDFWKFAHQRPELLLDRGMAQHPPSWLDRGGLTLNVSEDRGNLRDLGPDFSFEPRNYVVGLLQAEGLVEFQVLFDVEPSCQILHADIVHAEVVTRSHSPYAIENVLVAGFPRHRVDHHITVREDGVHSVSDLADHLIRPLECNVARQAHRQVGEVAVAGPANTHSLHFNYAVDLQYGIDDAIAVAGRSRVEKRVNRLPR